MLAVGSSHVARVIASSTTPISYGGDRFLVALNLLFMMAGAYLGAAMLLSEAGDIWRWRRFDRWNHPVTAQRLTMIFASLAAFIRCGAEAATILGWDPRDAATGAVILNLKHYLDPVSIGCLFAWMTLRIVSKRAVNAQLRVEPLPMKMWATLPQLIRPLIVVVIVAAMSFGAIYLRGR
ncbi:hypothetical protein [Sphingomonas sp. CROZ-RG-20F-R02-07]|uniref:hypothetical protein n=1 Tax=Sphingomonas sp. CROZ-RG-20F-R02-07 TaxID=2914832 RepID=UPI001F59CDA6|nr:hypothetical protein [Sphingomonas sp. CROZ-RG-20F-R02-07]